eukprot:gene9258-6509_t
MHRCENNKNGYAVKAIEISTSAARQLLRLHSNDSTDPSEQPVKRSVCIQPCGVGWSNYLSIIINRMHTTPGWHVSKAAETHMFRFISPRKTFARNKPDDDFFVKATVHVAPFKNRVLPGLTLGPRIGVVMQRLGIELHQYVTYSSTLWIRLDFLFFSMMNWKQLSFNVECFLSISVPLSVPSSPTYINYYWWKRQLVNHGSTQPKLAEAIKTNKKDEKFTTLDSQGWEFNIYRIWTAPAARKRTKNAHGMSMVYWWQPPVSCYLVQCKAIITFYSMDRGEIKGGEKEKTKPEEKIAFREEIESRERITDSTN